MATLTTPFSYQDEEKFHKLFEYSPVGMALIESSSGEFLEVNPSLLRATGYTKQEFLNLSFWDITPKGYEDQEASQAVSLKEKGFFGPNEKEYIRKDGSLFPIRISGFSFTDAGGRDVVWGLIEDISQQKAAEEITRGSEQKLQDVLDAAQLGYWDWDYKTGKQFVNDRWLLMLGLSRDEINNDVSDWESRTHPDDMQRTVALVEAHAQSGEPYVAEFRMKHADGHWVWIQGSGAVVERDPVTQEPTRLCGVHQDITERKEAARVLEESEARFHDLLESIPSVSVQGYRLDGTTIYWNKASERLYGYTAEEAVGCNLLDLIIPDEMRADVWKGMQWMEETGRAVPAGELLLLCADGSRVPVFSSHAIVHAAGRPSELFCVDIDLTELKKAEKLLRKSEERLLLSQRSGGIGTWEYDFLTNKSVCSDAVFQDLGFPLKAEGSTWDDVFASIHLDDHSHVHEMINRHISEGAALDVEYRIIDTEGQVRWMRTIGKAEFDEAHNPISLRGTVQDISAKKKAEEKILLSSRVFSDTREGAMITDANKYIVDVNPAFCEITGYSREEVIGQTPSLLHSGKQSPEFYQQMWQEIGEHGHWQGEVWSRKKSGEIFAELLTISSVTNDNREITNYIGTFADITSSKRQQEELNLMAHYDVLTKLPNRSLFVDRFHQAIAHSKRTGFQFAVCFLDLDDFKPVNDEYGHKAGDELLVEVAKCITANIREEDTVSRQGGDEFAILLNDIEDYAQCEYTLGRIHHALAEPFLIDGHHLNVSASSGVTLYPSDEGDIDTLLRHADQAMYQAKLAGKHRYHLFDPLHDEGIVQKHHQLAEIQKALANHEFQLYYQPKVNMVTGDVFGVEALIRWIHPEKGLIPPLDFLPAIEGTSLEFRVGEWVVLEALRQLNDWQQQGLTIEVSVNISSNHLLSGSFTDKLNEALAKYPAVNAQNLQLEILESSALGDLNAVGEVLKIAQEVVGVSSALDDFGTGYSSLAHLRNLPIKTLKIDQSFVRDILDDPSDYAIIDGTIGLADAFNRKVIAEGVETTNHGLMLLVMGCQHAQGYGIAKPMPAGKFSQWLKSYSPNQKWLDCAQTQRTAKEKKVALFRLVTEQWKDKFIGEIQSLSESETHCPIMDSKYCLCGTWLKRAESEQLFEMESLKQLNHAHQQLHLAAEKLLRKNQARKANVAQQGLDEFQSVFNEMMEALDLLA